MKAKEEKNKVTLIVILDLLCCLQVCVHHVGHGSLRHCHRARIHNFSFLKLLQFIMHGTSKFVKLFFIIGEKK